MLEPIFFQFLKNLEQNNNKEWFDQNRTVYEKDIKKPFEEFTIALGNEINKFDAEIAGDFKKSIFRINRDIRFSKNKDPYKNNRSAAFSLNGKKDHDSPGYYIELGANRCAIAGGAWSPSPEKLYKIRSEIYYHTEEFYELLSDKNFQSTFRDVLGEKSKKLPKDIADWTNDSEYIFNKQYYFWMEFDQKEALKPDFYKLAAKWFSHGYAMNQFFRRAMRD